MAAEEALATEGLRGRLGPPTATGTERLSQCELGSPGGEVQFSLDAAPDAVRRYFVRITETSQFSGGDPKSVPHPVGGVGTRKLRGAAANWIPDTHELLSVRGKRVLIASVSAGHLRDRQLRAAAIALSLYAWERLARKR